MIPIIQKVNRLLLILFSLSKSIRLDPFATPSSPAFSTYSHALIYIKIHTIKLVTSFSEAEKQ